MYQPLVLNKTGGTATYFCSNNEKMQLTLHVKKSRSIGEIQEDFNKAFPFLKIDFYENRTRNNSKIHEHLNKENPLKRAGITQEGTIQINDTMTVGELERSFMDAFGANVQVSRRSGSIWLETTMTDNWTLLQQNEHGRELSVPAKRKTEEAEFDRDQ